ncbi:MAG TPA: VIT and VWA domain-containing protein [Pyrinomonadaceae bacterium]|nr:VIT and VWA domain-containing protein [Pyrinomonadaceae bacterium]
MSRALFLLLVLVCAAAAFGQQTNGPVATEGSLAAYDLKGKPYGDCPLKNTSVRTDISGFIARVRVRQEFENPYTESIEAVYTFPLSQKGAVDDMTMTIGTRVIRGKIMKREDARAAYETAKGEGKAASLLDQERPNIFTQSVANIMPGEKIAVEISYVETLTYEDGAYEFVFPMTIGARYSPASVNDAAKIAPPIAGGRPGHDISIEVNLNAGVPIEEIRSTSHEIQQLNFSPSTAKVTLKNETTIPNKDFVLRYDVTGKKIEDAVIATRGTRGGFFTMVLQPPDKFSSGDVTPKEIVFVLDTSGSMSGFPIEKAKEAMKMSLDGLNPSDTFNLITFAGDTTILFDGPVPATQANLERAQAFLESRNGAGGTEMMKAIKAALDPSDSKENLRIVCFMTDGYVGNEDEIISEIQKHAKARVFSFGIGSSVNRHLLDKMAEVGNGEVEYVSLEDDGSKAAKKFYERVRTPLLTDISIDWNGMPVTDMYPAKVPDLFSAKPVIINGRYTKAGNGTIRLKGKVAGQEYSREISVNLPDAEAANEVLATLWARKRIDQLTSGQGNLGVDVAKVGSEVTRLGLEFRLLTENTSFVAVEERVVNHNGKPVTIQVPVASPDTGESDMKSADRYGDPSGKFAALSNGPGGGGGGGVAASVNVTSANVRNLPVSGRRASRKPKAKNGSGTGNGSGAGVGYGSGSASGGSAPPPVARPRVSSAGVLNAVVVASEDEAPIRVVPESGPLTPEMLRTQNQKAKLHAWLYALVSRLEKKTMAGPNESKFVQDGKAEIAITLSSRSTAILEKLRAAGFEMLSEKGNVLRGRIPIESLSALADMNEIKLILPNA